MVGAGLRFALGLDGTDFADDQDIWHKMRLLQLLHGGSSIDPAQAPSILFDAATVNGADVLNQPTGADLVDIDYDAMMAERMFDDIDEAEAILTRMSGRYVRDLYIGGRAVVANGALCHVDFEAASRELAGQARAATVGRADERAFAIGLGEAIRRFYRAGGH